MKLVNVTQTPKERPYTLNGWLTHEQSVNV